MLRAQREFFEQVNPAQPMVPFSFFFFQFTINLSLVTWCPCRKTANTNFQWMKSVFLLLRAQNTPCFFGKLESMNIWLSGEGLRNALRSGWSAGCISYSYANNCRDAVGALDRWPTAASSQRCVWCASAKIHDNITVMESVLSSAKFMKLSILGNGC